MADLTPTPAYSLYDLYMDLINGRKTAFQYEGREFKFLRKTAARPHIITSDNGLEFRTNDYLSAMIDIQGAAACLIAYNDNLTMINGDVKLTRTLIKKI